MRRDDVHAPGAAYSRCAQRARERVQAAAPLLAANGAARGVTASERATRLRGSAYVGHAGQKASSPQTPAWRRATRRGHFARASKKAFTRSFTASTSPTTRDATNATRRACRAERGRLNVVHYAALRPCYSSRQGQVSDATIISHLAAEVPAANQAAAPVARLRAALSAANITASEKRVKRLKAAAAAPPPPRRHLQQLQCARGGVGPSSSSRAARPAPTALARGGAGGHRDGGRRAAGLEDGARHRASRARGPRAAGGSGGYAAADKANVKQRDAVLAFRVPRRPRRREDGVLRADGRDVRARRARVAAGRRRLEALEPLAPGGRRCSAGFEVPQTRCAPPPIWSHLSAALAKN